MTKKEAVVAAGILLLFGGITAVATASHSWGTYHWGRTANPFTLKLGDNVSSKWDATLGTTATDWSLSDALDTVVATGNTDPRRCKGTNGRVEVCSAKYGFNGWLGIAQIWITGDHITKGVTKVNDSYFDTPTYNTPAWRNLVMCQEVGHTLGLDHQDEDFYNTPLGTCMDYSADPTPNQHPNQHDYDMLAQIYVHLDSVNTVSLLSAASRALLGNGQSSDLDLNHPSAWGKIVRKDAHGRSSLHERDLGRGEKVFTFVIWAR
jgi:hypothetical protein